MRRVVDPDEDLEFRGREKIVEPGVGARVVRKLFRRQKSLSPARRAQQKL